MTATHIPLSADSSSGWRSVRRESSLCRAMAVATAARRTRAAPARPTTRPSAGMLSTTHRLPSANPSVRRSMRRTWRSARARSGAAHARAVLAGQRSTGPPRRSAAPRAGTDDGSIGGPLAARPPDGATPPGRCAGTEESDGERGRTGSAGGRRSARRRPARSGVLVRLTAIAALGMALGGCATAPPAPSSPPPAAAPVVAPACPRGVDASAERGAAAGGRGS